MRRRSRGPGLWLAGLAAAIAVLLATTMLPRGGGRDGELWRRGAFSGEQLRLRADGTYARERWCLVCRDELLESGSWARFGQTLSLVPSGTGASARTLRIDARDGRRYLSAPAGTDRDGPYERVE